MLARLAFSSRGAALVGVAFAALGAASCQDYEFVFQPDDDREGTHLRFVVEQPSKADILFVIDNSRGMKPKQDALKASIGKMLAFLAPLDTSYRIGIISTDAQGYTLDCNDLPISEGGTQDQLKGNKGNCERCLCVMDGTTLDCDTDVDCTGDEVCNTDMPALDPTFAGRCAIDCTVDLDCPGGWRCNTDATPFNIAENGRCFSSNCHYCKYGSNSGCDASVHEECKPEVKLRRSHDGARGRLIAAFDPAVFDVDAVDSSGQPLYALETTGPDGELKPLLTGAVRTVLNNTLYTPPGADPALRVPWVIDREQIRRVACEACGCGSAGCTDKVEEDDENRYGCCNAVAYEQYHTDTCAEELVCGAALTCGQDGTCSTCFEDCAKPVARGLFTAYFNSNINGLGTDGSGYEEGIKAAMLAVGINPLDPNDDTAMDPGSTLTRVDQLGLPDGANTFRVETTSGISRQSSWIREEALLAIMFVTDEEDCSMPDALIQIKRLFEDNAGEPEGSICYQSEAKEQFVNTDRMADLLTRLKGGSLSRLTVGLIGGAAPDGPPTRERREATAADCSIEAVEAGTNPNTDCACMSIEGSPAAVAAWCKYTLDESTDMTLPTCDGMAAHRYVDFGREFRRRTFDSVCRGCPTDGSACDAYGDALVDFARLATLACFELGDIRPAGCANNRLEFCGGTEDLVQVKRASAEEFDRAAQEGREPVMSILTRLESADDPDLPEEGGAWFYEPGENLVCLVDLDRSIGDFYDIFILHRDDQRFSR